MTAIKRRAADRSQRRLLARTNVADSPRYQRRDKRFMHRLRQDRLAAVGDRLHGWPASDDLAVEIATELSQRAAGDSEGRPE